MVARRRLWSATRCCPSAWRLFFGTKPCSASKSVSPRKFAGGAKPTAVTFLGLTSRPPRHWMTSRYRISELLARQTEQGISVNPLFSMPGFSAELMCIDVLHSIDLGTTQDPIGNVFFDLVAGLGGTQAVFNFLDVCLRMCACVLVWVCFSVLRVHVQLCFVSLQALGSSARSRGAAGLLSGGTRSNFTSRSSTRNPSCRNRGGR